MSGFGVNAVPGDLYTVDFTTGIWTFAADIPTVAGTQPISIAYDCDASQMFLLYLNGQLYQLNTTTGAITLVGTTPVVGARGLAYDSANMVMYGCAMNSGSLYTVDTSTNTWTLVAAISPSLAAINLAYDCNSDTLYLLGFNPPTYSMYTLNRLTGVATLLGPTTIITATHRGLVWDQSTDQLYGTTVNTPDQMYSVNAGTGAWTALPNPTGVSAPVAMAFERPCCCVHEDALVELADGRRIRAGNLKNGDVLKSATGGAVQIRQNVCTGRRSTFVKLAANSLGDNEELLIQSGHPILVRGQEIECQLTDNAEFVELPTKARVFTFVTDSRSFVNVAGVMVATWSEDAFRNFVANDATGKSLHYTSQ